MCIRDRDRPNAPLGTKGASGGVGPDAADAALMRKAPKRAPRRGFGTTDERVGEVRVDNMGERCSMLKYPKISM